MRSGDKEVASAAVCQGPAAQASMDKKTPKKNRHSESVCGGGGGGCNIIEEGLHGSKGGRPAEGGLCQKDV